LGRLSVWRKVQMICTSSSWRHCHSIISCFVKIQTGLTFFGLAYLGVPGKRGHFILATGRVNRVNMHHVPNFVVIGWGAAYKYCDLMVFKLAAVRHLGFFKYEISAVNRVKRINMHYYAKVWGEWLNGCWDMMIYWFFSKWRLQPSWICCMDNYMDHSWRVFVGLDHCAKFGWNQCRSFDNKF